MDQNRDGFIDKEDLKDTYASLGRCRRTELHHSPPRGVLQSWKDLLCTWALQPDLTHTISHGLRGGGLGLP